MKADVIEVIAKYYTSNLDELMNARFAKQSAVTGRLSNLRTSAKTCPIELDCCPQFKIFGIY